VGPRCALAIITDVEEIFPHIDIHFGSIMVLYVATITLKNIPPVLHRSLKERAERNRRSLNSEVLSVLEAAVDVQERNTELLLEEAARFRKSLGFTATPDEIDAARRKGRP